MERLRGHHGRYTDGVFFTEELVVSARLTGHPLHVEISRQNANLREVKRRLAREVTAHGGNALVGFTYGQRSHPWWAQLLTLKWDTESWHGSGFAARL